MNSSTRCRPKPVPARSARPSSPQQRGITASGVTTVFEGHAAWADRQATTRLLGAPADHRTAPKSWRYRLHNALPGIQRLGPSRTGYEQGSRLIAQAVAELGTGLVNQVWKDLTLLPAEEEITDPAAWIYRIEGGTSVLDPLPRSTRLDGSRCMDHITAVVLDLLFDLTQQAARFDSGPQPWASLAAYDADDFASFTVGGGA
jgi:hypothetical protein